MDKDAQNPQPVTVPETDRLPHLVPASLADPGAVDDGDEEDGRL